MTAKRAPARVFLKGVPDNRLVKIGIEDPFQNAQFTLPGTAAFLKELHDHYAADASIYCPAQLPEKPAFKIPRLPLVNYMADADRYRGALKVAKWIVERSGLPCFNHPAAVAATTRDGVSRALQGIPGLIVPVTVRLKPTRPKDFLAAAEKAGLRYPVLVRLAGTQTGKTLTKIDNTKAWSKIFSLPWGGEEVYLSQFHDFSDNDGLYRKVRVVVIGDQFINRHQMASKGWMIHARSILDGTEAEEIAFIQSFDTAVLPGLKSRLQSIAERLQLDYFGIDLSLRPDGTALLFEANASMSMLAPRVFRQSETFLGILKRLTEAAIALIESPKDWRHPGTPAPHA